MNVLDQLVKHRIGARHYVRYVDDFVLLHESPDWLNEALTEIAAFLPSRLNLHLNPKKNYPAAGSARIDFVGQVVKPWHRTVRRRTFNDALARTAAAQAEDLFETGNSYFGLYRPGDSQPSRSVPSGERIASARDDGQCIADQDLSEGCMSALPAEQQPGLLTAGQAALYLGVSKRAFYSSCRPARFRATVSARA